MADDSEFEFPPDQISNEVALPPESDLGQIPFAILTQTPTDKLPPTHIPGAERRSIRQMLKGALHGYHRKPPFSALADLNLPHLRLSTSMDINNNNNSDNSNSKSPDTWTEAQKNLDVHYNTRNNIETALNSNFSNGITNNINNNNNSNDNMNTPADVSHGVETDFVHSSSQVNDPHVLHSGAEFDIAQSENWGPKRAIRSEWSEKQVRDFYTALSQYGTDFTAIAVLFKNRTRVDIKRLYNRELRRHPNEVRVALENRTPIDLNLFNKLLKTKRREEAPKHKVLAAEEEQMLKQIASSAQNPSISSELSAITTNTNANTNTRAIKHSSKGGVDGKESNNNAIADEFAFDDEMPSTGMEEIRRQVVKPHRLNTNTREDDNNNELHEPKTRKRDRVESSMHKAKQNTTNGGSGNVYANEEKGINTLGDESNHHTQISNNNNVGMMTRNAQHSSHSSRASSLHRTPQRQAHTKQKHQINEKQQSREEEEQEEWQEGHRIVPSISPSTSSWSPSPRRTDNDNDFDYKTNNITHDEKDDDETILEMELRRQSHQELEEEEFSDQMTLAEAAWAGEFGALSEEVNGNESQVDDEFHFDDDNGEDDTH